MLIIWGWRSLLKVIGVGEFHCPRCQADTAYRLVRPRRWFTIFWIPVIPLKWGETFVECSRCKGAYREQVLQAPTNKQFTFALTLAARAMYAKVLTAGSHHSEAMVENAASSLQPLAGEEYNEANVLADEEAFRGHDLAEYVRPVASSMTQQGRESLLSGLVRFAYAGGQPGAEVVAVLTEAAAALEISSANLAGIVATETATTRPPDA